MCLAASLLANLGLGKLYVPRTSIWIEENTYLEPDLFYVSTNRLPPGGIGDLRSADLVIEAFTRETALYDRQTKGDTYAALGVPELWLVDLSRHEIEQRILEAGSWRAATIARSGDTLRCHVLPGFTVNVAEVFEGLPRD
jgi:Uma2 family endonuclease